MAHYHILSTKKSSWLGKMNRINNDQNGQDPMVLSTATKESPLKKA